MHKFICITEDDYKKFTGVDEIQIVVRKDASLDEMCEAFTSYLMACGYHIGEGKTLDIVDQDGYNE